MSSLVAIWVIFPCEWRRLIFFLELFSREQLSETPRNYVPQKFKADYVKGINAAGNNVGLPIFLADGSRLGTLCLFDASTLEAESEWVNILTRLASTIENIFSSAYLMTVESGALQLYGSHKKQSLVQALTQRLLNVVDAQSLDLHERRQRKLQKNPTAFEMLQVSTWQVWPSLGKFEVSDSWVRLTGLSSDAVSEYTAPRLFQDFHPDDFDACLLQFNQFLSGESTSYKTEARVRGAENTWVWLSTQGWVTESDCEGKPAEVLFTHVDVSDQKKQAQHLENSQAFLDRTSRLAGVGGWEVDFQNNTVTWCNETRRIYGVGPDFEPVADHYIKYCAPDARHIIQAAVDIAMQGGPGFDLELPFVRLDKQGIWARVVGTVEFLGSTAIRMVGSLQDVSDRVLERLELAQANERATLATNSGGIGIWDWDVINDMLRWDSWMYHLYGALPNDLANSISWWTRQIHPDDISSVERALRTALQGGPSIDVEFRAVWPDGSLRYIHCTGLVKYSDLGEPIRMVGTNRDVTNARHLATELSEQHEMLRVTLKSIGDAVITTDAKGNVAWLNPVAENLTGWLSSEASGLPLSHVFHIIHQNTGLPAEDPVAICLRKEIASSPNNQTLLVSRTGQEYGIEDSAAPIRNEHGEILGAVLVFHDVTEQRRLSSELNYRASHDHLTGLVNRAEFETRLGRALRRTHESGACHTLLYIDLDQFKLVNDACGHAVGDQVLQQVSKLLSTCVRERDTLARLGGDEFGVILEHCCAEHALRVAQNICDAMEKFRFLNEGRRFRIGASIGLVPVDSRWNTTLALQQAADTSCYAAKEAGRNRVHAWFDSDTAMHARHGEMQWTMRIEQALDEGRFVLYAQRITPLNHSSNAVHAEVLLRMLDADGALIPPGAFLPAAERFHLASRIDRWVLTRAIEWMEALPADARVETLSINLSGQSVGDRAFHAWTLEVLLSAGSLVCSRLCFEVTETSAVTNFSDAALFIEQIRAVGVRVALDDFGAGASSFGYLKTLPVDYLKIDGQFVKNVVTDSLDDAAVRCFIDVARVLGVKTVAEYVENITVQNHLRDLGVDFVQGYLLHRPSPINDLVGNQSHLYC
ncbi:EAL domain-containing protein [Pseudomonas sp. S2_H01]